MHNLAAVDAILKHQIERPTGNHATPIHGAVWPNPALAPDTSGRELLLEITNRLDRKIAPVDVNHDLGFGVIDDQPAIFHVVAERRHAAHPHALSLGGGDLVAHTFADD